MRRILTNRFLGEPEGVGVNSLSAFTLLSPNDLLGPDPNGNVRLNRSVLILLLLLCLGMSASGCGGRQDSGGKSWEEARREESGQGEARQKGPTADPESDQELARKLGGALLTTVEFGRKDQALALIRSGASVNTTNDRGDTPLILAAVYGHLELLKMLLDNGAEVNAKNNLGNSALMEASASGRTDIIEVLLEKGADVDSKNSLGSAAVDLARNRGELSAFLLLSKSAGQRAKLSDPSRAGGPADGLLPNATAEQGKDSEQTMTALSGGVNSRDRLGRTPLMRAADSGDIGSVESLLTGGADPNLCDLKANRTALILAVLRGNPRAVKTLLDGRADPNVKDAFGKTALAYAQESGHAEIGRLLRLAGAKAPLYNQLAPTDLAVPPK